MPKVYTRTSAGSHVPLYATDFFAPPHATTTSSLTIFLTNMKYKYKGVNGRFFRFLSISLPTRSHFVIFWFRSSSSHGIACHATAKKGIFYFLGYFRWESTRRKAFVEKVIDSFFFVFFACSLFSANELWSRFAVIFIVYLVIQRFQFDVRNELHLEVGRAQTTS